MAAPPLMALRAHLEHVKPSGEIARVSDGLGEALVDERAARPTLAIGVAVMTA